MKKICKDLSIDAPYQMLINLAKKFQKRRFFNVSANQKESSIAAMFFVRSQGNEETS